MRRALYPCLMIVAMLALLITGAAPAAAQDWANWRGPNYNGSTELANLPTDFDKSNNVKWAIDLPGPSAATPIVVGERVFVSSATNRETKQLLALCFDRNDGKLLWQKQVGSGYQVDDRSNLASPSPVSDGKIVIFFYGTGDLACFTVEGEEKWRTNIQEQYGDFAFLWTFSTSPLLYEGKLYLQVLQRDEPVSGRGGKGDGKPIESYILLIDPSNGKLIHRHVRPADARAESLEAFTTPTPNDGNGRKEIIIAGGDCITGHDPDTFKELWRWGTWNPTKIPHWRLVSSPVAGGGVVILCGPKNSWVYAVKPTGAGAAAKAPLAWESDEKIKSDVATPLFYKGSFYVLNTDRRELWRLDPATGKAAWRTELPGRHIYRASPAGADGKIWCMNHAGTVVVVDAEKGDVLHSADMGEPDDNNTMASIAVAHGCLFIRTNSKLYCVGK